MLKADISVPMTEWELRLRQRTEGRLDRSRDPAILNAALAALAEHGYDATNMNDIAARAGVGGQGRNLPAVVIQGGADHRRPGLLATRSAFR